jgi:ribonuclease HI
MLIEVYSDGSGNTFDSDGGYGWRLVVDGTLRAEGNGYLSKATNNVAEITAAIEGLKYAGQYLQLPSVQQAGPHSVVLVADSQLVLGYANGAYACKALHLTTLYIELKKAFKAVGATTRWVRGHSGDEHNEGCDKLAKTARNGKGLAGISQPTLLGGSDPSQTRDGDGEET